MKKNEPKRVRLTDDFLDLKTGMAYPKGTVLIRLSSGQYGVPETKLGQECIWSIEGIKGIYEVVEHVGKVCNPTVEAVQRGSLSTILSLGDTDKRFLVVDEEKLGDFYSLFIIREGDTHNENSMVCTDDEVIFL